MRESGTHAGPMEDWHHWYEKRAGKKDEKPSPQRTPLMLLEYANRLIDSLLCEPQQAYE